MKGKTAALILMMAVIAILSMVIPAMAVSDTEDCNVTWHYPTTNSTILSGLPLFNISISCTYDSADGNATNATFEYRQTGDTTWTNFNYTPADDAAKEMQGQAINKTYAGLGPHHSFERRLNTTLLKDVRTYEFRVKFWNGGTQNGTHMPGERLIHTDTQLGSFYINNTVPKIEEITSIDNYDEFQFPVELQVYTANGTNCTWYIYDTDTQFKTYTGTMDRTTDGFEKCKYEFTSDMFPSGIRRFVKVESKDLGKADSTTTTWEYIGFYKQASTAKKVMMDQDDMWTSQTTQPGKPNLGKLALVALIVYGVYWLLKKRK